MTKRNKLFLVFSLLLCAALSVTALAQSETAPTATPAIPYGPVDNEQQAEAIAIAHAGLTAEQVTNIRSYRERDDGVNVYEVEFYTADAKYEYQILPEDGQVRSWEYDVLRRGSGNTEVLISDAQAWEIARNDAGVPADAEVTILQEKLEYDDGFRKYWISPMKTPDTNTMWTPTPAISSPSSTRPFPCPPLRMAWTKTGPSPSRWNTRASRRRMFAPSASKPTGSAMALSTKSSSARAAMNTNTPSTPPPAKFSASSATATTKTPLLP